MGEEDKKTNIQILVSTREKLRKLGFKGDTYDDILLKLLNEKNPGGE